MKKCIIEIKNKTFLKMKLKLHKQLHPIHLVFVIIEKTDQYDFLILNSQNRSETQ